MLMLGCAITGAVKALTAWQIVSASRVSESSTTAKRVMGANATKYGNNDSQHSRIVDVAGSPVDAIAFEHAVAVASGSSLYGPYSILHKPDSSKLSFPSHSSTSAPFYQSAAPLLVTEADTARAIALESVTCKAEPFTSTTLTSWAFGVDRLTRISLFAMNIGASFGDTASSVTADAEDSARNHYPLQVEYLSELPVYPGLYMVVVRLNENLESVGDVLVRIYAHGQVSNVGRIGIGFVGAGLPDESAPQPMLSATTTSNETLAASSLPYVTSFELHDAANNIYTFPNGAQLTAGALAEPLRLYAVTGGAKPGSVRVKLANIDDHYDNNIPYDTNAFRTSQLGAGNFQMMGTAYTRPNGRGNQGGQRYRGFHEPAGALRRGSILQGSHRALRRRRRGGDR